MKPSLLAATLVFSVALLVPGSALGNYSNQLEDDYTSNNNNNGFTQQDLAGVDVDYSKDGNTDTNETALKDAHQELTEIMMDQNSSENLIVPDIPFIYTYVAGDKLVVGIHFVAQLVGIEYTEQQIQDALGYDLPIVIEYGYVELESHVSPGLMRTYESLYSKLCSPVKSGFFASCKAMAEAMVEDNKLPSSELAKYKKTTTPTVPSTTTTPPVTSQGDNPCVDDIRSSECTYYKNYNARCHFHEDRSCDRYKSGIEKGGYNVEKLFSYPLLYDLRNYNAKIAGDDIIVFWDNPILYKYVKLYGYIDGKFKYFGQMPKGTTSYTVDAIPGKEYKFYFKVYYSSPYPIGYISYKYFDIVKPIMVPLPDCGSSQILEGVLCVDLPKCKSDEKLVGLECVDRCPASNEEWNGAMCIVTSCDAGFEVKDNTCVEKPKPVQPVTPVEPVVVTPPQNSTKVQLMGGMEMFMTSSNFTLSNGNVVPAESGLDSTLSLGVELDDGTIGMIAPGHGITRPIYDSFYAAKDPFFFVDRNNTSHIFANTTGKISVLKSPTNNDSGFIPVNNTNFTVELNKIQTLTGKVIDVVQGNASKILKQGMSYLCMVKKQTPMVN